MNASAAEAVNLDLSVQPGREVRALLRAVWGVERDLEGEYPLLFDDTAAFARAPGRFVVLRADGVPVAACGYLERDFVTPHGELRLVLLGSVSTHPQWRGRGFAGHVLAGAHALAEAAGGVATLLWPMDVAVYTKSGYRPAACEWNIVLPGDLALGRELATRPARPIDTRALLALYDAQPVRVRRTAQEFARLMACPGMDMRVAFEHGRPVAYAARGRGGDLGTCVHEWAGEPQAVLGLVSAFAREDADSPRYLLAPDWAHPVTEALLDAGCAAVTRPLGHARLASRAAAGRFLASRTGLAVEADARGTRVALPSGDVWLDDAELLTAILPPANEGAALASVAARLSVAPERLPAYAFCFGLDSI
jgi:GNAT superfamily N-acetyltransferase